MYVEAIQMEQLDDVVTMREETAKEAVAIRQMVVTMVNDKDNNDIIFHDDDYDSNVPLNDDDDNSKVPEPVVEEVVAEAEPEPDTSISRKNLLRNDLKSILSTVERSIGNNNIDTYEY